MRYETIDEGYRSFVARTQGDEGRAWLASLPRAQAELADRWRLELGRELTGGLLSSVREATLEDGRDAVLKIGYPGRTGDEIAALRLWAGGAAPALFAADEDAHALLLERIEPGTHPTDAAPEQLADLLRLLHIRPPDGLPTLGETVRRRIDRARRDGRASERKVEWAYATVVALESDAPSPRLLHGDLDERNLLVCARRGLCAIDPLPCAGDPAYDAGYWVHGNRRPGRRARLDAIVAATGLERARVRDWAAVVGVHG